MEGPSDDQIRAAYAAFGTDARLDSELLHPDLEWHNDPEFPEGSVHRGIEAVRRDLARQREAWGEARYEPVEIIRLGEKILVLVDVQVTGKASGAPVGLEGAHVLTLLDGKVAQVQAFTDRARALAAAGLKE